MKSQYLLTTILLGMVIYPMLLFSTSAEGAQYPKPLTSKNDIEAARQETDDIDIRNLPIEDYILLPKFKNLKKVTFWNLDGRGASDAKLNILSGLGFTNLAYININNCLEVTDGGIRALAKIPSLKELTAEGIVLTDTGCEVIVSEMRLTLLRIANCQKITFKGLKSLSKSDSIAHLQFSADNLSTEEVLELINFFSAIVWCEIIDPKSKLDADRIKSFAKNKKIKVSIYPKGALQFLEERKRIPN